MVKTALEAETNTEKYNVLGLGEAMIRLILLYMNLDKLQPLSISVFSAEYCKLKLV